jgi:drug/metabolite transporter (DMT)-like permease
VLAVALSLAASCSWGVADFAGGLFSRRWHAVAVLLVVETAGLLTAGIIVVAAAEPFPDGRSALLALVAGTAGIAGLGLFFSALSVGSMSIVAPLAATGAVVPVAVGVATGDRITVVIGIGLAIALAGIALAAQ